MPSIEEVNGVEAADKEVSLYNDNEMGSPEQLHHEEQQKDVLEREGENVGPSSHCLDWWQFDGVMIAKGYNILGAGRGCLIMSNIFLATALTYLASKEVGCLEREDGRDDGDWVVTEDCDERVRGVFRPASLITNIAVIWGVLSALLMPLTGAIIDYTPHRWKVGVGSALFLIVIQAVQIGVASQTWFAMAILQAISGFLYQVQNLSSYAYLPTIAQRVGEEKMTKYISTFTMVQFSTQAMFLVLVVAVSLSLGLRDVNTARTSQALNTLLVSTSFYFGWRLMPQVPAKHTVPEGKSVWTQGFIQNWQTAKKINREYRKGLRWFLLSVVFGESAANAFTIVSVVFLDEQLGLSGSEVGVFFFLALVAMIPGGLLAHFVTERTNPKTSIILSMIALFVVATVGALSLDKDSAFPYSYIWGLGVGLCLGWYYPVEGLFLSMVVPPSMEAEIAGFFVYCTQILGWLPPLVFSILVEHDIDQGIAVVCISGFFIVAIGILCVAAPWDEILQEIADNEAPPISEGGKGTVVSANSLTEQDNTECKQPGHTE